MHQGKGKRVGGRTRGVSIRRARRHGKGRQHEIYRKDDSNKRRRRGAGSQVGKSALTASPKAFRHMAELLSTVGGGGKMGQLVEKSKKSLGLERL